MEQHPLIRPAIERAVERGDKARLIMIARMMGDVVWFNAIEAQTTDSANLRPNGGRR